MEGSMWTYRAQIDRVVDADTFDVTVDLGFLTWTRLRVRLVAAGGGRLDAAEDETRLGAEAAQAVAAMLPAGTRVVITSYKLEHPSPLPDGSFGRWAAAVELPGGADLGGWLVDRGYATV